MKKTLISLGILSLTAFPALAAEGAADACKTKLDAFTTMAQEVKLEEARMQQLQDMLTKANEQAKAGDEEGCKATAAEIEQMLGVKSE